MALCTSSAFGRWILPAGGVIATANPGVVPERVYFAYGTGSTGIMQIVDRKKLLDPNIPATDFATAELGHWVMNPDNALTPAGRSETSQSPTSSRTRTASATSCS